MHNGYINLLKHERGSELIVPDCGTVLNNKYSLKAVVGAGAGGTVFRAHHLELDRMVALKVLHAGSAIDDRQMARFHREAQVLSNLNHKNICRFYEYGFWREQHPYFCMEFVEGRSLQMVVGQEDFSFNDRLKIMIEVANALTYAHKNGFVHRDLKMSNLMLCGTTNDAREWEAKIVDFGLARLLPGALGLEHQRLTMEGSPLGSVGYMSPEQCQGIEKADGRSDVYSFGCILYELFSGRPVFTDSNAATLMYRHVYDTPELPFGKDSPDEIECDFQTIIMKCLEKDAVDRFQSMGEVADQLQELAHKSQALKADSAARAEIATLTGKNRTRSNLLVTVSALLVFFVCVVICAKYQQQSVVRLHSALKQFNHAVNSGQWDSADQLFRRDEELFASLGTKNLEAETRRLVSQSLCKFGVYQQGEAILKNLPDQQRQLKLSARALAFGIAVRDKSNQQDPDGEKYSFCLLNDYVWTGAWSEGTELSKRMLTHAAELHEYDIPILAHLATCYLAVKKDDLARDTYLQALEKVQPTDLETISRIHQGLATYYGNRGNLSLAEQHYLSAVGAIPSNVLPKAEMLASLSYIQASQKKNTLAKESGEMALRCFAASRQKNPLAEASFRDFYDKLAKH